MWNPSTRSNVAVIERVQRQATKLVKNLRNKTFQDRLISLGLMNLEDRRARGDLIQMFKIVNGYDQINLLKGFNWANSLKLNLRRKNDKRFKNYFDYVTERLIELFDSEKITIIKVDKENKLLNAPVCQKYVNQECYGIKIDPTSVFIQLPYFTRFISYVLFWGYFSIQTLFLKEIFTDTDQSQDDNEFVCFNVSTRLVKALYRCERYDLKSIDEIFESMDQIAGVLALHELNKYVFKFSFKFFKWFLLRKCFSRHVSKLINQYENKKIPLVSLSQLNYIIIIGYLTYVIYDNLVTEKHYIPIKFVCYSVLIYSSILSAFETVKYLISQKCLEECYEQVLIKYEEDDCVANSQDIIVNTADNHALINE
ncbi:unnamed protein product [Brachionus calyciflorus]|uniref:Uncharacterized protein n=1 Tax=Brachionus calyciflorus TaxID=104777 RepID=A0A814HGA5_9BILA|nr:unnamed protein product [Brachionus calyciflorus]